MHRDGVPEGDKKRLYQHARLALHEMDSVNNLIYLGVNVSKVSSAFRRPPTAKLTDSAIGLRQEAKSVVQAAERRRRVRHLALPADDQVHARGA